MSTRDFPLRPHTPAQIDALMRRAEVAEAKVAEIRATARDRRYSDEFLGNLVRALVGDTREDAP